LSLLGSADFYIITTIFVLYVKSFYPDPSSASQANQQATILQGIFFTFAVVFCVIYGFLIDKMNNLYISDKYNHVIRMISNQTVYTICRAYSISFDENYTQRLCHPRGICWDKNQEYIYFYHPFQGQVG